MRVNAQFFLVRIVKDIQKKQRALSEVIPGLIMADTMLDMKHYLQAAPVLQIGEKARQWFPEVHVGDTLIFHHTVEDDDWRIIDEVWKDGDCISEDRIVECTFDDVLGVKKQDGTIIPSREIIWTKDLPDTGRWHVSKAGLFIPREGEYEDDSELRLRIEELDNQVKFLAEGIASEDNIRKINELKYEQAKLTNKLNKPIFHRMELAFIHPETSAKRFSGMTGGDHVFFDGYMDYKGYPLKIDGVEYFLARIGQIAMGVRKENADISLSMLTV
jgi:hypothetical protein